MQFNSEELLKQFGESCGIAKPGGGLWCKVSFHCTDCDLFSSCELGRRNDYAETKEGKNPCGHDLVLRHIEWRDDLRKYAFKPPFEKDWHEHQDLLFFSSKTIQDAKP